MTFSLSTTSSMLKLPINNRWQRLQMRRHHQKYSVLQKRVECFSFAVNRYIFSFFIKIQRSRIVIKTESCWKKKLIVYIKLTSHHNLRGKNANFKKLEVKEGFRRKRNVELAKEVIKDWPLKGLTKGTNVTMKELVI